MYRSASNRYIQFCTQFNLTPLPLQQNSILRFVAHLANSGVGYSSIRSYLCGIRFLQIANGLPDPQLNALPMVGYILRGIHRSPSTTPRPRRLPITPHTLTLLFAEWSQTRNLGRFDAAMLWAACCTGFFGFMRAGEFTCSSMQAFSDEMLSPKDVSVDAHDGPSIVSIHLRRSKADPFGNGVTIHLGKTGHTICPVSALLGYLALRGQQAGPLFLFQDGRTLSKERLMAYVHQALTAQGFDHAGITGHSFRVGAATAAAQAGLEDSTIQMLGRWRSSAYLRYIRIPRHVLAAVSTRLIGTQH